MHYYIKNVPIADAFTELHLYFSFNDRISGKNKAAAVKENPFLGGIIFIGDIFDIHRLRFCRILRCTDAPHVLLSIGTPPCEF